MGEDTTQQNNAEVSMSNVDETIVKIDQKEDEEEKVNHKAWDNMVIAMGNKYTFATPECMASIKFAAALGCSDREICAHAQISPTTLYKWIKEFPLLGTFINIWKEEPVLKARSTIVSNIDKDDNAKWYLERKTRGEFANQQKNYNAEITEDTMTEDEKNNLKELLGI